MGAGNYIVEMEAQHDAREKGGLKTIPFIIANEICERIASVGLLANMIIYLSKEYHMNPAKGATVIFIWSAISNFTPMLGAFLSDSYMGRFRVIASGSLVSLIGMILLWLTAVVPGTKPPACNPALHDCRSPTSSQLAILFSAFGLMSIGAGGIRPCSLAFGANQLKQKNYPNKETVLQTFFSWYYASVGVSMVIAVTVIVYIQDRKGFNVGFGVPVVLMLLSVVSFLLGTSLYVKVKGNTSMLSGFAQVFAVSFKNRHLALPPKNADGWYHHKKDSRSMAPTEKLRFLNKACMVRTLEKDLRPDGSASNPWNLCTVEQVEDVKSVIRLTPIWSSGFIIAVVISQQSFPVLQAATMDRHIGSSFEIPAGSFTVFGVVTLAAWVALYHRLIVPRLAKITGRPRGLSLKQRMGIGLLISCMAMAVAAQVESIRRGTAIREGVHDNAKAVVGMSAMWLVPQYCLIGLAEAFSVVGQIEFYYSELPKSMASFSVALFTAGLGVGNLLGSLILTLINRLSGSNGSVSWIASNLNKGRYDYYYWIIALLSAINFIYYLVCSWAYGDEGMKNFGTEEEDTGGGDLQILVNGEI